jgi:hypothetical protein
LIEAMQLVANAIKRCMFVFIFALSFGLLQQLPGCEVWIQAVKRVEEAAKGGAAAATRRLKPQLLVRKVTGV